MSHGLQIKCTLFLNNIKELLFIFLFFDSQILLKYSGILTLYKYYLKETENIYSAFFIVDT